MRSLLAEAFGTFVLVFAGTHVGAVVGLDALRRPALPRHPRSWLLRRSERGVLVTRRGRPH